MALLERFGETAIYKLNVDGFTDLNIRQQNLIYFLSQAGLYGRDLYLHQTYKHNVLIRDVLHTLYTRSVGSGEEFEELLEEYIKCFWVHCGIYHSTSGKKLPVPFDSATLDTMIQMFGSDINKDDVEIVSSVLFDAEFAPMYMTVQAGSDDVVAASGVNFYDGVTSAEVAAYRSKYTFTGDKPAPHGFNERISKDTDGNVVGEIIHAYGLYGQYITKIAENIERALEFTENREQHNALYTLLNFYYSGTAEDFDIHSEHWAKDSLSNVFVINGLIESYADPLGIGCTFESVVAFKNPAETAKVKNITDNIQWFEDNMPVNNDYKKEEAAGLSASSITVVSMAGATSPGLPLGICLPNSDWIRAEVGSKSVNLANVHSARDTDLDMLTEFYLPEYHDVLKEHGSACSSLHTDLHEVAGHGSCKLLPGVASDSLGVYSAVIEEARADLVGLHYLPNTQLQAFGVVDSDINLASFATAGFVQYMSNGAFMQLRRVELGEDLTQAHTRNRQLVANWVLERCKDSGAIVLDKVESGRHYIKINNIDEVKDAISELLSIVQDIKSTGNFEQAKQLVEQYGTKVDQSLHEEVLNRVKAINPPTVFGFVTPIITPVKYNKMGRPSEFEVTQPASFVDDQLRLTETYRVK